MANHQYGGYIDRDIIIFAYKYLSMKDKASCENVANVLNAMGYRGKRGNKISRHVVFRALNQTLDGQRLLAEKRERIGK